MALSSNSRPKLLDLFCGAGGAAMGYHRAGFEVIGYDIKPQPNYPFEFWRGDAMEALADTALLESVDAIHASPPCQEFTAYRRKGNGVGPDRTSAPMIPPVPILPLAYPSPKLVTKSIRSLNIYSLRNILNIRIIS